MLKMDFFITFYEEKERLDLQLWKDAGNGIPLGPERKKGVLYCYSCGHLERGGEKALHSPL